MRNKIESLVQQQFSVDYEAVLNDLLGREVEDQHLQLSTPREVEQFHLLIQVGYKTKKLLRYSQSCRQESFFLFVVIIF